MRIDDEFLGGAAVEIGIAAWGIVEGDEFDIHRLGDIHATKENLGVMPA